MDTFIHRLRHRPINEDLKELQNLQEELCELRLKFSKLNKSKLWEKEDIMKILASLKNNKSRDHHRLVNKYFKPGVGRADLVDSMLMLFLNIKKKSTSQSSCNL